MKDKIILFPFEEALRRYKTLHPSINTKSIVCIGENSWKFMYEESINGKTKLVDIDDIVLFTVDKYSFNVKLDFGFYRLWIPYVCIDFKNSRLKNNTLFLFVMNILEE